VGSATTRFRRSGRDGPWCRSLFLDAGPVVGDPVENGVIVALAGLPGGSLRRVTTLGELTPHRGRMEGDSELSPDQFDNPAGTPQVGAETVVGGFLSEPRLDKQLLGRAEKVWPSRK
jgi:hypothetical protein